MRRDIIKKIALIGAGTVGLSLALAPTTSSQAAMESARALPSCGRVVPSDGPQRRQLRVHLNGPNRMVAGGTFKGTVVVSLSSHAAHRTVGFLSEVPTVPVITRGGRVVGEYEGPLPGVRIRGTVSPNHPFRFPRGGLDGQVVLRGCPVQPSKGNPSGTRALLPPGRYTLYVYIEDSVGKRSGYIRSAPFQLRVLPRRPRG